MSPLVKESEWKDKVGPAALAAAVPLGLTFGVPMLMGNSMKEVPNQHMSGAPNQQVYGPVWDSTQRVRAGKGSMMDHMNAYSHPGAAQSHWLYGPMNRLGPGLRRGVQDFSTWVGSNGVPHGMFAGGVTGAATGLLSNAILAMLGKQQFSPLKSSLIGGGIGAVGGGSAAGYRNHVYNTVKSGAWRGPGGDQDAQRDIQAILGMLRQAPGLSFNERAQLMSGVGRLDPNSARQLRSLIGFGGGAGVGAIIARFLVGKGFGTTVIGALVGGVIGNALFNQDRGPRTFYGTGGLSGVDLSGRSF